MTTKDKLFPHFVVLWFDFDPYCDAHPNKSDIYYEQWKAECLKMIIEIAPEFKIVKTEEHDSHGKIFGVHIKHKDAKGWV